MGTALSKYEKVELGKIHEWKSPSTSFLSKAIKTITYPVDAAGDLVMKVPGVNVVIEKSVGGLVSIANDAAQWSINPETVYGYYRKQGYIDVRQGTDIHELDLADVDRTIGWLAAKYKGATATHGGLAGGSSMLNPLVAAGAIAADISGLVTLNLRAIGEYGTYCGFDMSNQAERLFAMNVLAYASSPTDASKNIAMAQLVRISQEVAKRKAWDQLEKHAFVVIIRRIAEALGVRLTKAKLAQVVPGVGVGVGVGFNAYFTSKVTNAAFYLYRERMLASKYGEDIIAEVVKAAATFEPGYEETEEAEEIFRDQEEDEAAE